MTHRLVATSVVALALFGWVPGRAHAADTRVARGTILSIAGDALTIKVQDQSMTFGVDAQTRVEAVGGATKMRAAQDAGRPGPTLSDVLRTGQSVEVSYRENDGMRRASRIRAIPTVDDGSGSEQSSGVVKSLSATSMTISGSQGKAKFVQTFAIDPNTKVIGKGAGTRSAANGGRTAITDLVSTGDSVSVSYRKAGDSVRAAEIHVLMKHHASSSSSSK
jgi:Domain of unknown function (DUF5666)